MCGYGDANDRIDIFIFPVNSFCGYRFANDISFCSYYGYEYGMFHHLIEIVYTELVEQNTQYEYTGRNDTE